MRKKIAVLLVVSLIYMTFSGFISTAGIGNVYYHSGANVFDKAEYSSIVAENQKAFTFTSDLEDTILEPYVYDDKTSNTATLNAMVSNIEAEGYKVVAGINGDLYDSATGTPKGAVIHDGQIKTGGYQSTYLISFDSDGKASLVYDNLKYTLNGNIKIDYFNVPHGAANGLHLYNSSYGSSTGSTSASTEVVANIISGGEPKVGGEIKATVASVKTGAKNTAIGKNQIVLSCVNGGSSESTLKNLSIGNTITVSVSDESTNEGLKNSSECIGVYHLLYAGGQYRSSGTAKEPRTCLGIKSNGDVVMYIVDGRQTGRNGLSLTEVAQHMVSLGCTTVVNMDGGGSATMNVRESGKENNATQKNSPSDGSQRKVTNGLFLVYKTGNATGDTNIVTYMNRYMAMPGAYIYPTTYLLDSNYEGSATIQNPTYGDTVNNCSFTQTLIIAGNTGKNSFTASHGGSTTLPVPFYVWDDITLDLNVSKVDVLAEETVDINVLPLYHGESIASIDSLYNWSCDSEIGSIDSQGRFTAGNRTGIKGDITVTYGNKSKTIQAIIGFNDIIDHWAQSHIEKLWQNGVINGKNNTTFDPSSHVTRAEFVKMLALLSDADIENVPDAGFSDCAAGSWYYKYVNWAANNGIVIGVGNSKFAPSNKITREEMCKMIVKYADVMGTNLSEDHQMIDFSDTHDISLWAKEFVEKSVKAGIVNGMTNGKFEPNGNTKRSEAAKVVSILYDIDQ